METRLFHNFFETSKRVVELAWELLIPNELQPRGGSPEHLLWTLHFLKVYPKQGPGSVVIGTSNGVVNVKTYRKWVLAFIDALAELVDIMVSM